MKYFSLVLFMYSFLVFGCGNNNRPEEGPVSVNAGVPAEGVNVSLDAAKKAIVGRWHLVRISKWYADFGLEKPSKVVFKKDGDYEFSITLKDKGKLSYRGTWTIALVSGNIILTLKRTHRAFENDWKSSKAEEGAIVRFLNKKLDRAIIIIANVARHKLELKEEKNSYWVKIKKRS